jgi:hypothetical protein
VDSLWILYASDIYFRVMADAVEWATNEARRRLAPLGSAAVSTTS